MATTTETCIVPIASGICEQPAHQESTYFGGPVCDRHWPAEIKWRQYLDRFPAEREAQRPMHHRMEEASRALDLDGRGNYGWERLKERLGMAFAAQMEEHHLTLVQPSIHLDVGGVDRISGVPLEPLTPDNMGWEHFLEMVLCRIYGIDKREWWREKDVMLDALRAAQGVE